MLCFLSFHFNVIGREDTYGTANREYRQLPRGHIGRHEAARVDTSGLSASQRKRAAAVQVDKRTAEAVRSRGHAHRDQNSQAETAVADL